MSVLSFFKGLRRHCMSGAHMLSSLKYKLNRRAHVYTLAKPLTVRQHILKGKCMYVGAGQPGGLWMGTRMQIITSADGSGHHYGVVHCCSSIHGYWHQSLSGLGELYTLQGVVHLTKQLRPTLLIWGYCSGATACTQCMRMRMIVHFTMVTNRSDSSICIFTAKPAAV